MHAWVLATFKLGMCPVPTLFSVLMNDLVSMLSEQNLGVNLASDIINCLLFADDIVLMGKSEQELQTLLNITARFASK